MSKWIIEVLPPTFHNHGNRNTKNNRPLELYPLLDISTLLYEKRGTLVIMENELKDMITQFDKDNCVKQIILIGVSGVIRNIELEVEEDGKTTNTIL